MRLTVNTKQGRKVREMGRPKVGDHIQYKTNMGATRSVLVIAVYDDIKNGWPGFDGIDIRGHRYWGYDDQVLPEYLDKEVIPVLGEKGGSRRDGV